MAPRYAILATARAAFPKSANKTILVASAWHPYGEVNRPAPNGWDEGWSHVGRPATHEVIAGLAARGYTWVNLQAGGTARPFRDVPIASLLLVP